MFKLKSANRIYHTVIIEQVLIAADRALQMAVFLRADAECLAEADARAGFLIFSLAVSDDVILPGCCELLLNNF